MKRQAFYQRMLVLLCFVGTVHAAPASLPADDIEHYLDDHGLVQQLGEIKRQVGSSASDLVLNAMNFLGVPYRRGGTSAETGFDCSGFVRSMYEQTVGLVLPRRARDQAAATQTIDKNDLKPGDLVFFNTMKHSFSHVGIYLGDNKFIHSPRSGEQVRIDDMRSAYWQKRFNGARRVQTDTVTTPDVR